LAEFKRKRKAFELLFLVADLASVAVAWMLTVGIVSLIPRLSQLKLFGSKDDWAVIASLWVVIIPSFRQAGLYRMNRTTKRGEDLVRTLNGAGAALLIWSLLLLLWGSKDSQLGFWITLLLGLNILIFTAVVRGLVAKALETARSHGYYTRNLLVIGTNRSASDFCAELGSRSASGIRTVGYLRVSSDQSLESELTVPVLGELSELNQVLKTQGVDQVLIALTSDESSKLEEILTALRDSTVDVKIIPDFYQYMSIGGSVADFSGIPVISLQESPLEGRQLINKRIFDICLSFVLLLCFFPLFVVLVILVKLSGKGPVLFLQERVSLDGTSFNILKFRSMRTDSEKNGPGWTTANDSRVTKIGAIMRKTSLDELPQLWNVFVGDMSLVGPRPERPVYIDEFRKKIPSYMLRHKVPAGITGWAQINGWRGDTSIEKRVECDLYYIRNWSFALDIKILFLTFFRGFVNKNAY
jgi:Undecaprenyl-phosphate glucose phosphotransferase